jgi:prophage regulatory protein
MAQLMRRLVAEKHLRRRAVEEITGLSRTTIYSLMARGEFPRPIKLTRKVVGWPETAIAEWLVERAKIPG